MEIEDKKLLEFAAKACGIDYKMSENNPTEFIRHTENFGWIEWNPLKDDGDALRLAAKLRLDVLTDCFGAICIEQSGISITEFLKSDNFDDVINATRRAIVRAAAENGEKNGD